MKNIEEVLKKIKAAGPENSPEVQVEKERLIRINEAFAQVKQDQHEQGESIRKIADAILQEKDFSDLARSAIEERTKSQVLAGIALAMREQGERIWETKVAAKQRQINLIREASKTFIIPKFAEAVSAFQEVEKDHEKLLNFARQNITQNNPHVTVLGYSPPLRRSMRPEAWKKIVQNYQIENDPEIAWKLAGKRNA